MTDYTNSQTKSIEELSTEGMNTHIAEVKSESAEIRYRELWGPRGKHIHVKSGNVTGKGWFHFSDKWIRFLKFENDITVFFDTSFKPPVPIGWLTHKQIQERAYPCRLGGLDLETTLNPMSEFDPKNDT